MSNSNFEEVSYKYTDKFTYELKYDANELRTKLESGFIPVPAGTILGANIDALKNNCKALEYYLYDSASESYRIFNYYNTYDDFNDIRYRVKVIVVDGITNKTTNHYYFYGKEVKNESESINDLVDVYIIKNSREVKSWTKSYDELIESVIDDPDKYQVYGCVCAGDEGLKFVSKIVVSKYGVNETLINI